MGLTNTNRVKLAAAAAADERIRGGDHFSDWLALGIGLITLRDLAMNEAHISTPHGRGYSTVMGRLMKEHPWSNRDKPTRSHAMWLADNMSEVIAWRDTLALNKREVMNHPTTVKRNYEKAMVVKEPKPKDPNAKPTVHERITELEGLLADAEERNAHLEGKVDGGTFDFVNDSFEDIKAVIDRLPHRPSLKAKVDKIIAALVSWRGIPAKNGAPAKKGKR